MMSIFDSILQQMSRYPRAIQWAIYAGIAMVLFFVWDSTVRPLAEEWRLQGDGILKSVADIRSGGSLANLDGSTQQAIVALGPVETPRDAQSGRDDLHFAVNEVLKKHPVTGASFDSRSKGVITSDTARTITGGANRKLERIAGELKFDATVEQAIGVIADLESRPEIESVSSVRLTRDKSKKVKVRLTVESWVLGTADRRAGT